MASYVLTSLLILLSIYPLAQSASQSSTVFREYIGAEDKGIKFSDVPINPNINEFHFILSFAIDYAYSPSINSHTNPSPTNGHFHANWDTHNPTPQRISSLKSLHPNVKVAMSLGGDTVGISPVGARVPNSPVYFKPTSISSWVSNAILSITHIVTKYNLDGIDIDYEHFEADPDTFAECIGRLLFFLKDQKIVSFASIAPFQDDSVQPHYMALWRKYGHLIDYVNFQFYAYDEGTTVAQFLEYFEVQSANYVGGKVLVSFGTDGSGGFSPAGGFFDACEKLRERDELHGIFVWSADDSLHEGWIPVRDPGTKLVIQHKMTME